MRKTFLTAFAALTAVCALFMAGCATTKEAKQPAPFTVKATSNGFTMTVNRDVVPAGTGTISMVIHNGDLQSVYSVYSYDKDKTEAWRTTDIAFPFVKAGNEYTFTIAYNYADNPFSVKLKAKGGVGDMTIANKDKVAMTLDGLEVKLAQDSGHELPQIPTYSDKTNIADSLAFIIYDGGDAEHEGKWHGNQFVPSNSTKVQVRDFSNVETIGTGKPVSFGLAYITDYTVNGNKYEYEFDFPQARGFTMPDISAAN
jgi:hypothetical protein